MPRGSSASSLLRSTSWMRAFGLEMVPAYDEVIERAAERLPTDARIGLLGLKHPAPFVAKRLYYACHNTSAHLQRIPS